MDEKIKLSLSAKDAAEAFGISERLFHALRGDSTFPQPRPMAAGGRCLRWSVAELRAWFDSRPRLAKQPEPSQLAGRKYKSGELVPRGDR